MNIVAPPPAHRIDIVFHQGRRVGYIQYCDRDNKLEISIGITEKYNNMGIGSKAIIAAVRCVGNDVVALIREDNIASQKAFKKSGFKKTQFKELRYIINLNRNLYMDLWAFTNDV